MHILPNFSSWTLRRKLFSAIIISSAICLLISLSFMAVSSISSRHKDSLQNLIGLADVIAENGQAALIFSDHVEAERLLGSLEGHLEISSAWLITADGTVLASWFRDGKTDAVPADYKVESGYIRSDFWTRRAYFYRPVTRSKEQIGYVLLKADFTEQWRIQFLDLGKGLGGAIALAMLFAFLLANRMQRIISNPIEELAKAAHTIAQDKTYELRVPQYTNDEIGSLVFAFNEMLSEIQKRDKDLTNQRDNLEKEVSKRISELHTILENTPDTIARYDCNCRRTYVNQAFGSLVKDGIAALIGKTPSECPGGPNSEIYEAKIKEVFAGGQDREFELKWADEKGKEIYSHIRLTAERDSSGTITSVLGIGRDITEHIQTELKDKALVRRIKVLMQSTSEGIHILDYRGNIIEANDAFCRHLGCTLAEVLQLSVFDIEAKLTADEIRTNIKNLLNDQATFETVHRRKDGTLVAVEVTVSGVTLDEQDCLFCLCRDITVRKNSELALTQSMHTLAEKESAKSRFLAAAGHDLRQPLAAASLFLDALKFTEPTTKQNQIIQRLDQSMSAFSGLLDSLLNISKLDSGVIKPELAPINVTDIFSWLDQSFAQIASENKIGFKLYFSMKETLVVFSDKGLLKSILSNLVSNAIKFTSKGAVLISARKRGNEVLFQVWDTGIGISGEYTEHIFDEFYQIGNPQRDRTAGLGLGLAIVKRAITLLGSRITCRSQIGRGSVFGFRLPLDGKPERVSQQATIEVSQAGLPDLSLAQGKRFVVVEDDLLVAQALTQSLEGLGGEVECFHSAEDALHHINIGAADCYIVDYMLSGALDGIEFLNLLRQKLDKPINAILMTGDTSPDLIQKEVDFDWPVLHKPVSMLKLISALCAQGRKHT